MLLNDILENSFNSEPAPLHHTDLDTAGFKTALKSTYGLKFTLISRTMLNLEHQHSSD